MAIDVVWKDRAKTILLVKYQHPWTWSDFKQAQDLTHNMAASVEHSVGILHDWRNGTRYYLDVESYGYIRHALHHEPPNISVHVGVGMVGVPGRMLPALFGVEGRILHVIDNYEEALRMLTQSDSHSSSSNGSMMWVSA
ncbi:MAG: hypothetical protein GYB68_02465 [Chloroflexi bacterium]|nr:hypothetical protein [Chloroflexota bacterium]